MATTIITSLDWTDGADATERGWWYTVDGVADILESGTLDADSDRAEVLAAIARKLHVDSVVEKMSDQISVGATTKQMDQAMGLATEYRTVCEREGSNHARARQIRRTIEELVAEFIDGKLTIPAAVRAEMGL